MIEIQPLEVSVQISFPLKEKSDMFHDDVSKQNTCNTFEE